LHRKDIIGSKMLSGGNGGGFSGSFCDWEIIGPPWLQKMSVSSAYPWDTLGETGVICLWLMAKVLIKRQM
jgi:hypothetical protein